MTTKTDLALTAAAERTDAAIAEAFARHHAFDVRFDHRRGAWFIFRAGRWGIDRDGEITRRAIQFARLRQGAALDIADLKLRADAVTAALRLEDARSIDRMLDLARSMTPVADDGTSWDGDAWLLGTPSGTVDLRTGVVRPPDPADRITRATSVPCGDASGCPRFQRFVNEVFDGDEDVIAFVRRFAGYSLSGDVREQVIAVMHGLGANGKSTLLEALAYVFGDYHRAIPFSTLESKDRASVPNDLAILDGPRLVTASETNDGARLNEARIKALTGGDTVSARYLFREFFEFRPQAKIALCVNHRPVVRDESHGFWRRVRLVPFAQRFDGARRDANLLDKLHNEAAGILRWLVDGCLEWQRHGLGTPAAVAAATEEYRADSDALSDFLAECTVLDPTVEERASLVQRAYAAWAEASGLPKVERLTARALGQRMAERFTRVKRNTGAVFVGVRLRSDAK